MDLFLITALSIVVILGLGTSYLVWLLFHKIQAGLALVMLLFVWETVAVGLPGIILKLIVYPQDFVFLLMGVAAALRLAVTNEFHAGQKAWLAFGFFLFASVFVGLVRFGTSAGVEFREYYYFWSGTAYFMSFSGDIKFFELARKAWIFAALVCVATACFRWTADALGLEMSLAWAAVGARTQFRVLNAAQTLMLGQALLMLIYSYAVGRLRKQEGILIPIFLGVVLVLQHRSVWISVFASVLVMILFDRSARTRLIGGLGMLVVPLAGILLTFMIMGGSNEAVTSVASSAAEIGASHGSFIWRINSWEELLREWLFSGPVQYLFGQPFGSGFIRFIEGVEGATVEAPHNYYVQTLLRVGLTGMFALLLSYWIVVSDLLRNVADTKHEAWGYVLPLLLFSQLVYFIPYSANYSQCVLLGLALASVKAKVVTPNLTPRVASRT